MAEAVTKYLPDSGLFHYNLVDLAATRLSFDRLCREGACEMALFDHAMTGPALTMSLRGLRVDESAAAAVLEETWDDGRRLRKRMDRIRKFDWTGKAIKPKPHELAAVLYDELRAPVQSNRDGGRTVNKEALDAIINSPKSSDEAVAIAEAALELTRLEEDRKVIEKPRGRDGRFHTGLGVATAVTSRWSSRKDAFNEGGNLHAMNRRVRRIFIADDGFVLVNRDLSQAESLGVAFLSGCEAYKRAHYEGNVHLFVGNKLWPRPKPWTKDAAKTPVPFNPDIEFYDLFKRRQHACLTPDHEVLTPHGWIDIASVAKTDLSIAIWHSDSSITFERPVWNAYFVHSGVIVELDGATVSQAVTEDHRLPWFSSKDRLGEKRAVQLPFTGTMPVSGKLDGASPITPEEARLVAATWADGNVRKLWTVFSFKKDRKKARLKKLLTAAKRPYRIWKTKAPGYQIIATPGKIMKALDWSMLRWPQTAIEAFLDELPNWDGSTTRGAQRVYNSDLEAMQIIQTLAHVGNRSTRVRPCKPGNRWGTKPMWTLTIAKAVKASYAHIEPRRRIYTGHVFCPTTSSGWFMVRRNGNISVTGNSNYGQTPHGFARLAHIPVAEAKRSDAIYFGLFPEIKNWHREVEYQLKTFKRLTTPMGRVRQFLGRTYDGSTLKEAIAHVPQSMISDINKIILWRLWRHLDPHLGMTLLEVHDSVLCQVRDRDVADFVRESTKMAQVEIPVNGDTLVIGSEVSAGRNWGDWDEKKNPTGLKKVG